MKNRQLWQLKNIKIVGAVLHLQLNSTANSAHLAHFLRRIGWIGSAIELVAPKQPPEFRFFQLPWGPIIHLNLFPLSIECPNLLNICNTIFLGSVFESLCAAAILLVTYQARLWHRFRYIHRHKCIKCNNEIEVKPSLDATYYYRALHWAQTTFTSPYILWPSRQKNNSDVNRSGNTRKNKQSEVTVDWPSRLLNLWCY